MDEDRESLPTWEKARPVEARRTAVDMRFLKDLDGEGEAGRPSEEVEESGSARFEGDAIVGDDHRYQWERAK